MSKEEVIEAYGKALNELLAIEKAHQEILARARKTLLEARKEAMKKLIGGEKNV